MCYLCYYAVAFPASAVLFNNALLSLIEFREINPIKILGQFDKKFDLETIIFNISKSWAQVFDQYMIVILIVGAVVLLLIILGFLYLIPTLKPKVKAKTEELKDKIFFNGIIRSV